jgi:DNA-binding winged helix-turn-helix (wHTH) protein
MGQIDDYKDKAYQILRSTSTGHIPEVQLVILEKLLRNKGRPVPYKQIREELLSDKKKNANTVRTQIHQAIPAITNKLKRFRETENMFIERIGGTGIMLCENPSTKDEAEVQTENQDDLLTILRQLDPMSSEIRKDQFESFSLFQLITLRDFLDTLIKNAQKALEEKDTREGEPRITPVVNTNPS